LSWRINDGDCFPGDSYKSQLNFCYRSYRMSLLRTKHRRLKRLSLHCSTSHFSVTASFNDEQITTRCLAYCLNPQAQYTATHNDFIAVQCRCIVWRMVPAHGRFASFSGCPTGILQHALQNCNVATYNFWTRENEIVVHNGH
jgi:hypothetical protein